MSTSTRTFISLLYFVLSISQLHPGFIASTKISTPTGQTSIENLAQNSSVVGYNDDNQKFSQTLIEKITTTIETSVIKISTEKETIISSLDQLFYDTSVENFVPAFELTTNSILVSQDGQSFSIIRLSGENQEHICYDLTLPKPHHFFCGESRMLVHNFAAASSWLAPMLKPIVGYIVSAVCLYANQPSKSILDVSKVENILQTYQQNDKVSHKTVWRKSRSVNISDVHGSNRHKSSLGKQTTRPVKITTITKPATSLTPYELGVSVIPNLYRQIAANRNNFGVYSAIAAITNKGKVACTLLISELNFRKRTSSGTLLTSWKKIGYELYSLNDPFVKQFVRSEHIKQHNKIVNYVDSIKNLHLHIKPFSSDYAKNTRDLERRYGKLSKTIYGHTFGIHALSNIAMHRINPAKVIEAIYDGLIVCPEKPEPMVCGTGKKKITDRRPPQKTCAQYPAKDTLPTKNCGIQMPQTEPMNCGLKLPDHKPILCGTSIQLLKKQNVSVTYKPKNKYILFADIHHHPIDSNQVKTIEDLLALYPKQDDQPSSKKSRIHETTGGYSQGLKDFYKLNPTNIRLLPGKEGLIGTLPNGRTIILRNGSSQKSKTDSTKTVATIEVQSKEKPKSKSKNDRVLKIKIRYYEK